MVLSPFFEKSVDDEDYFSNLAMKYGAVVGSIVTGVPFYLVCIYKRTRLGIFDKLSGKLSFSFYIAIFLILYNFLTSSLVLIIILIHYV